MLARPYLIILYIIFPIHANFPITSRCVLKATIHRKKLWIKLCYLRKFFFQKDAFVILNIHVVFAFFHFIMICSIFHVPLSIIYQLFSPYHILYMQFFLNIHKGFFLWSVFPNYWLCQCLINYLILFYPWNEISQQHHLAPIYFFT